MNDRYDIGALFHLAFAQRPGIGFQLPAPPSARQVEEWVGINSYKPEAKVDNNPITETKSSWLGTEVMFPWTLKGGGEVLFFHVDESGKIDKRQIADFPMPAVTLVDFSREKVIAKSQPLGGNGTVKELFGLDDWKIRIRGLCLDDYRFGDGSVRSAAQQKQGLHEYAQVIEGIKVEGYLFSVLGIHSIVIENLSFRQLEGKPWVIPFEMDAISDIPIELMS